jgi:hypothetical protein
MHNLPSFWLFLIVVEIVVFVVVIVFVEAVVVLVVVLVNITLELDVVCKKSDKRGRGIHDIYDEAGSVAGFGFSRLGGGYVDQKWRPHRGQTQNWSGRHAAPGAGSRSSISAPQR